jgi:hypothetical protein
MAAGAVAAAISVLAGVRTVAVAANVVAGTVARLVIAFRGLHEVSFTVFCCKTRACSLSS